MSDYLNRLPGAAVALAGLFLVLVLIPDHTEPVDYGWVRPQTMPMVCGVALFLLGVVQAVRPAGRVDLNARDAGRAALFFVLTMGALFVMSRFGYLAGAAALAFLVMVTVGERRIGWIALGAIVAPAAIWTMAVPLLDRTLP